ncbi:MAG TPA: branched-chain amino acid aminotransferase, partial [Acidimicrobiales bacterium]|nr:branched-chain amino acid aminotransferase [Acidimicrobiales bacterium]
MFDSRGANLNEEEQMAEEATDGLDSIDIARVDLPTPTPDDVLAGRLANPGFGKIFTDHMVVASYEAGRGWHDARLTAYRPFQLEPAAMVFHYGQAIFEGLKAFPQQGGGVSVFRPADNARRMDSSAHRLAMPELPSGLFEDAVAALVAADARHVPTGEGQSLYLRPFMIATEPALGVRPSDEYVFCVIASPADPIFNRELKPVTVWLSREYVRAAPGGTGSAKVAGNYAASLLAQREAVAEGCDQVVWLDAIERRYIEEMGGMNLCFVFDDDADGPRLVTPELTGTL